MKFEFFVRGLKFLDEYVCLCSSWLLFRVNLDLDVILFMFEIHFSKKMDLNFDSDLVSYEARSSF